MTAFVVVYRFLCPNCNHLGVGQFIFRAADAGGASRMLSTVEVPCRVCDRNVTANTSATTLVFTASDQELLNSETGEDSAVPRT